MFAWVLAFLRQLVELGWSIDLYKRYIDDVFALMFGLNKGWGFQKELHHGSVGEEARERTISVDTADLVINQ